MPLSILSAIRSIWTGSRGVGRRREADRVRRLADGPLSPSGGLAELENERGQLVDRVEEGEGAKTVPAGHYTLTVTPGASRAASPMLVLAEPLAPGAGLRRELMDVAETARLKERARLPEFHRNNLQIYRACGEEWLAHLPELHLRRGGAEWRCLPTATPATAFGGDARVLPCSRWRSLAVWLMMFRSRLNQEL